MKSLTDLQQECIAAVHAYVDKANAKLIKYPRVKLEYPRITFDLRGRSVAGLAHPNVNWLQLHNDYILQRPDYYVEQVAGHEAAHLITSRLWRGSPFKIKDHGDEWAQVMWTLGLPATRCWRNGDAPSTAQAKKEFVTKDGIVRPVNVGQIITFD